MSHREVTRHYRDAAERHQLASRILDVEQHPAIHAFERDGRDPPAVLVHGGGAFAHVWLPLLDHLGSRHVVVPDRPGFGLSNPVPYRTATYRQTAVQFVDTVLDALEVEAVDLVGNSAGGVWSLWYALDRPERVDRLVLIGAPPLLPDARIPPPLRLMAAPGFGELLNWLMAPSPKMVKQIMGAFGEEDTIGRHPELVDAMVAAGHDPVASTANLDETRAILTAVRGFRPQMRIDGEDLAQISAPTLIIWGSQDPVGAPEVARQTTNSIPNARLEMLDAGHLPWLGHPDRVGELTDSFLAEHR